MDAGCVAETVGDISASNTLSWAGTRALSTRAVARCAVISIAVESKVADAVKTSIESIDIASATNSIDREVAIGADTGVSVPSRISGAGCTGTVN